MKIMSLIKDQYDSNKKQKKSSLSCETL